ncbi:hypothetical protein CEK25_011305 [Fusarium fujikuroi]|nr:hypothetical protein CEK25_011305 [Fusarium fujikuroi]
MHYGPTLTASEVAVQNCLQYTGMMTPEGTRELFFWRPWCFHTFFMMLFLQSQTSDAPSPLLFALGVIVLHEKDAEKARTNHLDDPSADFWMHGIETKDAWTVVFGKGEEDKPEQAVEDRANHLDDVAKDRGFKRRHGIEPKNPVVGVFKMSM